MASPLTQEEIDLILQNADRSITDIVALVGRSKQAVIAVLRRNGHPAREQRRPFSADEDAFLRAHFRSGNADELAAKMGRSVSGVHMRASRLGLTRYKRPSTPKSRRDGPGKPPLSDDEKTVMVTVKMPESMRDKLMRLGGSEWLRKKIEGEKE